MGRHALNWAMALFRRYVRIVPTLQIGWKAYLSRSLIFATAGGLRRHTSKDGRKAYNVPMINSLNRLYIILLVCAHGNFYSKSEAKAYVFCVLERGCRGRGREVVVVPAASKSHSVDKMIRWDVPCLNS
jgi:hypothetical protein